MARIAGVNIPNHQHTEIALTAIYGVGRPRAQVICDAAGVARNAKIKDLSDAEVDKLREQVGKFLVEGGQPHGLVLAGYHALNSLRMEKGYRHWGHDVTPDTTPLEAGLGFAVAWDKPDGFIGKDALVRQRETGLRTSRRVSHCFVRE